MIILWWSVGIIWIITAVWAQVLDLGWNTHRTQWVMRRCRGWNEAASHRYIYISHFTHCFTLTSRMYICEISAQARRPTGGVRWGKRWKRAKAFHRSQHLISGCVMFSLKCTVIGIFERSRCLPVVPRTKMQRSRAALRCDQIAISVAFFESHPFFYFQSSCIQFYVQPSATCDASVYIRSLCFNCTIGHFLLPC